MKKILYYQYIAIYTLFVSVVVIIWTVAAGLYD